MEEFIQEMDIPMEEEMDIPMEEEMDIPIEEEMDIPMQEEINDMDYIGNALNNMIPKIDTEAKIRECLGIESYD